MQSNNGLARCCLCLVLTLFISTAMLASSSSGGAAFVSRSWIRKRPISSRNIDFATNGEQPQEDNAMSQNQLMHIMLRVTNVNATTSFWEDRGARVHSYRISANAETAFVGFHPKDDKEGYFSLEITKLSPNEVFQLGNAIRYFGLSMLMGMDLRMAAAGEATSGPSTPRQDPNGIEVRPVASAPGDFFARLCLQSAATTQDDNGLVFAQTIDFYQTLGMELVAADESLVCLRYTNDCAKRVGVATTLVFEKSNSNLELGNCFDHMAISTANVDAAAEALKETLEEPHQVIFLEPTRMFGTKVMGLHDPNGYKVYLVEQQKQGSSE